MRLTTRLLVPLLFTVAVVMAAYGLWALQQRETTLADEARRETEAYATALGLALEAAYRDPDRRDVEPIINRISVEPKIYGVIVYGRAAEILWVSRPLQGGIEPAPAVDLHRVIATGEPAFVERWVGPKRVYASVRPIHAPGGGVVGAFEVVQPLEFVEEEKARTRQRFLLNTLTLVAALTLLITWLVRRHIGRPLQSFVAAVRAVGRGELTHRIEVRDRSGELAALAHEFNRMADHLESARERLVQEAEERIELERRLREAEKLAAVGNLAAGVAHEIAAPLQVIRGRAEMLARAAAAGDDAAARNLRIITEQTSRITGIVRSLLDYARRRDVHVEPVDVRDAVSEAVQLLEPETARAGVEVRVECLDAGTLVDGDPHLLHQVLTNLLVNAVHALADAPPPRLITIRCGAAAGCVTIDVEDSGAGIPADALPRIFEPFFTTKPAGSGTGLGLAIARGIVEEHGGTLEAASDGGGARFRIALPAATGVPQHA
jgi:two-component system, NtrC family, sensor kinase